MMSIFFSARNGVLFNDAIEVSFESFKKGVSRLTFFDAFERPQTLPVVVFSMMRVRDPSRVVCVCVSLFTRIFSPTKFATFFSDQIFPSV